MVVNIIRGGTRRHRRHVTIGAVEAALVQGRFVERRVGDDCSLGRMARYAQRVLVSVLELAWSRAGLVHVVTGRATHVRRLLHAAAQLPVRVLLMIQPGAAVRPYGRFVGRKGEVIGQGIARFVGCRERMPVGRRAAAMASTAYLGVHSRKRFDVLRVR